MICVIEVAPRWRVVACKGSASGAQAEPARRTILLALRAHVKWNFSPSGILNSSTGLDSSG